MEDSLRPQIGPGLSSKCDSDVKWNPAAGLRALHRSRDVWILRFERHRLLQDGDRIVPQALTDERIAETDHRVHTLGPFQHHASEDRGGQVRTAHFGMHPPDPDTSIDVLRARRGHLLKRPQRVGVLALSGKLDRLLLRRRRLNDVGIGPNQECRQEKCSNHSFTSMYEVSACGGTLVRLNGNSVQACSHSLRTVPDRMRAT